MSSVPLEDESDHLADSDDAGTESNGTLVVHCEPPDRLADVSTATSVRSHGKVPDASRASDHELLASIQEVAHPKEGENLEDQDVPCLFSPHDFSKEVENSFSLSNFSDREYVNKGNNPYNEPHQVNNQADQRQEENAAV